MTVLELAPPARCARIGALALLLVAPQIAFGATHRRGARLAGRRLHARDDRIRRAARARSTSWPTTRRAWSIDIDGLELSPQLRELVGKVRPTIRTSPACASGQFQPRVVRLVIDLKQAVAPQVFTLAPVAAYQHRLVFDLRPTVERDPLLALIREKEAAERSAAQSVRDALGEFIGRIAAAAQPPPDPPPAVATRAAAVRR